MKTRPILFAVVLASGTCAATQAADFPINHAVPDATLDTIRGGFDFGDNLVASFALQRTVLINGMEAMQTTVSIPNIANITAQQAAQLQSALQTTVINVGNNTVTTPQTTNAAQASATAQSAASVNLPASVTPGLIIQNTLDNQAITATTTIDASVNSARMLQNMRISEAVNDAVVQFRGN
jgi:hypothetical protein